MSKSQAQPVTVTLAGDGSQTVTVLPASHVHTAQQVGVAVAGSAQTVTVLPSS
jgi:hypothetical protein